MNTAVNKNISNENRVNKLREENNNLNKNKGQKKPQSNSNEKPMIKQFSEKLVRVSKDSENKGQVKSVKDGVAHIAGLKAIKVGEIIEFASKAGQKPTYGMALNLEKKSVGCVIFGDDRQIKQNDLVTGRGRLLDIEINKNVLGRVVDALGHPIDGKGNIASAKIRIKVERKAQVLLQESQ